MKQNKVASRKLQVAWTLLLASCFLLLGCSAFGEEEDLCIDETALFRDAFSADTDCGWAQYGGAESAEVVDDVMRLSVSTNGVVAWTNPNRDFTDTEISVQTSQISGPNNNAYGVICRYVDDENFYVFLISGDGYYAIGKYQTGVSQITYLTGADPDFFVASDAINQGVATNLLRVRCVGDQLSLAVNGIPLATVTDDSFISGDVGLAASTLETGRVVVEFDTFTVSTP